MAFSSIKWHTFLLEDSVMMPDVTFFFTDTKEKVSAHSFLLSLVSPVFRAQFAGLFEAKSEEEIRDTSTTAFKAMIDFLYKNDFKLSTYAAEDIFEIMKLADRYEILSLVDQAKKTILGLKITEENVVNLANIAKTYQEFEPFTELAISTFQKCADFLATTFTTPLQVYEFLARERTGEPLLEDNIKLELVKAILNNKCLNCKSVPCNCGCLNCKTVPCLDGQPLTKWPTDNGCRVKFIKGINVHFPDAGTYFMETTDCGTVTNMANTHFQVHVDRLAKNTGKLTQSNLSICAYKCK